MRPSRPVLWDWPVVFVAAVAVTASADMVEDLVLKFPTAKADELTFPLDDLIGPDESTMVPSVGREASHAKAAA